jgi:hypothetical protein
MLELLEERTAINLRVEISHWNLSVKQQRRIAQNLTPLLVELFDVPAAGMDGTKSGFNPYPPTDCAVGPSAVQYRPAHWPFDETSCESMSAIAPLAGDSGSAIARGPAGTTLYEACRVSCFQSLAGMDVSFSSSRKI